MKSEESNRMVASDNGKEHSVNYTLRDETANDQSWVRRIPPEIPIFLLFPVISIFFTCPVARNFTRTVYGVPSANLGAMRGWWWYRRGSTLGGKSEVSPFQARDLK